MEQIQNIEQLITDAMNISSKDERVKFVMNYFLNTAQYNYACLFAGGYGRIGLKGVSPGFRIAESQLDKEDITELVFTRDFVDKDSSILRDVLGLQDESQGDYQIFINSLRTYINERLGKHIGNDSIVTKNADILVEKIERDLINKKLEVSLNGQQYSLNYDISAILIDYILNTDANFPPEIQNGLLLNGVCKDYADYLLPLMEKIGVEAHRIEGTSEFGHSWVIVNGDDGYRSVDLTRAVAIRDNFAGIPSEQTSQDWLYSDIGTMFDMQSMRKIIKIDGEELPNVITSENYDEHTFNTIMMAAKNKKEKSIDGITLKALLEEGLREGISATESKLADKSEQIEKNERVKDEQ